MDRTTNWSVVIVAAVVTWAFSNPSRNHIVLLFGFFLVLVFLIMESRRYRFYDLWRARIRMLEEYFISNKISKSIEKPKDIDWKKMLASDLKDPRFKVSFFEAVTRRLRRIYIWIFLIVYSAWIGKLVLHPELAETIGGMVLRARIGLFSGGFVFTFVNLVFALLLIITAYGLKIEIKGERKAKGEIKEQKEEVSDKWKD